MLLAGCSPAAPSNADASVGPDSRLSFAIGTLLNAVVGQPIHLELVASNNAQAVTLWLEGKYLDASLAADLVALQAGRGTVVLRPPTEQATFDLVARSDDGRQVRLQVSASPSGKAVLVVTGKYVGPRSQPDFDTLVYPDETCALLNAASETQYSGHSSSDTVTLNGIPAGRPLAVVSRIRGYARGCVDRRPLLPDSAVAVSVTVRDVPIDLKAPLDATLAVDFTADSSGAWSDAQLISITRVVDAFHPAGAISSTWLLELMDAVSGANQGEMRTRRITGKWDTVTSQWLANRSGGGIRNSARSALLAARTGVNGPLFARIDDASQGTAQVTISSFGQLAGAAMLRTPTRFTWTADASDTLTLKGEIVLAMPALLAAAGDERARQSGGANIATAIATSDVACAGLASALAAADTTGLCGATCLDSLCRTAIASAWNSAVAPTQSQEVHLSVSAVALAVVGDLAQPTAFSGTWVGVVSAPDGSFPQFTIGGGASGQPPR
jgi:hypothetical protein